MKVLITGGSGFIGTNLVSFYIGRGAEISNLDIAVPQNPEHECYWKQVDLLNMQHLREEVHAFSPTHIFHLAARTGLDETRDINRYAANIQGVENLVAASRGLPNLQRIIFTSSMLVCKSGYRPKGDNDYCPNTLYGESKVLGEKTVRRAKNMPCSWVIVRPVGIWGPWFGTAYREFFLTIARGLYVHPGQRSANQALGFVGNTVYQLHRLATVPSEKVNGKTFYLADCPPISLWNWANLIQQTLGARRIRTVPVWVLKTVAILGDLAKLLGWKHPLLTSSRLNNMLTDLRYDIDPIIGEGLPYTLEEGVRITGDWLYRKGEISSPKVD